jgi:hypothetical protein
MRDKCDVLLEIVEPTQAEHSLRAHRKTTPEQNMEYRVDQCLHWHKVLQQTIARAFSSAPSLRRMGISTFFPSLPDDDVVAQQCELADVAVDLALCLVSERGAQLRRLTPTSDSTTSHTSGQLCLLGARRG